MWSFVVADTDGAALGELTAGFQRSFRARLDAADEASVSLSARHPEAELLGDGEAYSRDLLVYRGADRLLRGRVDAPSDSMQAESHTVTLAARGYRDLLARRHLEASQSWVAVEQEQIGWDMIAAVQALTGGDLGITRGADQATGVTRSRSFEVGGQVARKVDELAAADGGFEWDIDPDLVYRVWHPQRGQDTSVVLQYAGSGGNVRSLDRAPDPGGLATVVIATAQGALVPEVAVSADVATVGRWSHVEGVADADSATTLEEAAAGLLADREALHGTYTAVLQQGVWEGPDHLWLGDTCRLVIQSGYRFEERLLRVQQIDVAVDESDRETVTVVLDRPSAELDRLLRRQAERVTDLER